MTEFFSHEHLLKWFRIIVIDLLLAGDNALVIALAVRKLNPQQQFWGRMWGTLGAILLRLLFVFIIVWLLEYVPLLRLVGGLVLIWIALKLVRQEEEGSDKVRSGSSLMDAVWVIIVADVVMSLDNVIAIAAAAEGNRTLVVFGLLFSLPLVVWGSGILAQLMNRFKWIVWFGGGVLGYVAMEMIMDEPWLAQQIKELPQLASRSVSVLLGTIVALFGWWCGRKTSVESGS